MISPLKEYQWDFPAALIHSPLNADSDEKLMIDALKGDLSLQMS